MRKIFYFFIVDRAHKKLCADTNGDTFHGEAGRMPYETNFKFLEQDLTDRYGLDEELAFKAVQFWARWRYR